MYAVVFESGEIVEVKADGINDAINSPKVAKLFSFENRIASVISVDRMNHKVIESIAGFMKKSAK